MVIILLFIEIIRWVVNTTLGVFITSVNILCIHLEIIISLTYFLTKSNYISFIIRVKKNDFFIPHGWHIAIFQ